MDTARGDFVHVLSAENTCPQCTEVYAWVDQRVCTTCFTAVCPDCVAMVNPPSELLCRVCYASEEVPTQPVPTLTRVFRRAQRLSPRGYGLLHWREVRAWTQPEMAQLRRARERCAGLWTASMRRVGATFRRTRERCANLWTLSGRRVRETYRGAHLWGQRLVKASLQASRSGVLRVRQGATAQLRILALALWISFASARREGHRE